MRIFLLSFLSVFLCANALWAQTKFTATADPSVIGKNELTTLKLMVENAQEVTQITPPSLNNFIIVSGPNQESGMEINNGVSRQYIGLTYVLQPIAKGKFILSGAKAKADGKIFTANSVTIEVTNAKSGNNASSHVAPFSGLSSLWDEPVKPVADNTDYILKKGENIQAKINKNIFIKVATDKTSCYVGEPIVVTYKLYTRLKSESNIIKNPSFNGFSVIDLSDPNNTSSTTEKLNGRTYNVYTLRKSQLYPLDAGKLELETIAVENNIHFINADYLHAESGNDLLDNFGAMALPAEAMHDEQVTLQSKPLQIVVKPLPVANTATNYHGAVGSFSIDASVEKNNFSTDDAGKLHLEIIGRGNMDLINAPDVVWPSGIEGFEPAITASLNKQMVPVSGSKNFDFPFTVSKAGTYIIPVIAFTYFDAAMAQYQTITTQPITINISQGKGRVEKKNAAATVAASGWESSLPHRGWLLLMGGTLLFAGWLMMAKKKNKKVPTPPSLQDNAMKETPSEAQIKPTEDPFAESANKLTQQDSKGFYAALNKELQQLLSTQLNIPIETVINKSALGIALNNKGLSAEQRQQIQQLLDEVEFQLYTPFAEDNKMMTTAQMAQAVRLLVQSS